MQPTPTQNPTVLMVDDNPGDVRLLTWALLAIESPARLYAAADASAALAYLAGGGSPDVVVLDFNLPGETGLHVASTLHERPSNKGLPIVLLSGYLLPELKAAADARGVALCLEKPLCLEEWRFIASHIHKLAGSHASALAGVENTGTFPLLKHREELSFSPHVVRSRTVPDGEEQAQVVVSCA